MPAAEAPAELPPAIAQATSDQPAARMTLAASLASPSHAYLFCGPAGSGKRSSARAFVAELLASGAPDPDSARRRAMADPSPHPDLVWLRPAGAQHLVEDVRTQVIDASAYSAFEGENRVFVIEAAEAMAEESQNAMLKTLEEPAPGCHLILISSQPAALLETVRSRCQPIRFTAISPEAIEQRLAAEAGDAGSAELRAAARLASGDMELARFLIAAEGRALRAAAERLVLACRESSLSGAPWGDLLVAAQTAGEREAERTREYFERLAADSEGVDKRIAKRIEREGEEAQKRSKRRGRTEALDAGLALIAAWCRDLAVVAEAPDAVLTSDRQAELTAAAKDLDPRRARRAGELVMATRRRLQVNVSEELALEALAFRLEAMLRRA
jgi:DNA polymerase-3 subunit delta'